MVVPLNEVKSFLLGYSNKQQHFGASHLPIQQAPCQLLIFIENQRLTFIPDFFRAFPADPARKTGLFVA